MQLTEAIYRALTEAKDLVAGKGKITIKNVQFGDINDAKADLRKYKIKAKVTGAGNNEGEDSASLTGEKKDILAYLLSDGYGYPDAEDVASDYPKLFK